MLQGDKQEVPKVVSLCKNGREKHADHIGKSCIPEHRLLHTKFGLMYT